MAGPAFSSAALYPNDLAMLQRVFDKYCADGGLAPSSAAAEVEAMALLYLFQNGLTDEAALLAKMQQRESGLARGTG